MTRLLLLLLALTGCARPAPVPFGSIPRPPGLEIYEGPMKAAITNQLGATTRVLGAERRDFQYQMYSLPRYDDFAGVLRFYRTELEKFGWARPDNSLEVVSAHWARRTSRGDQRFAVARLPVPGEYPKTVLLVLFDAPP